MFGLFSRSSSSRSKSSTDSVTSGSSTNSWVTLDHWSKYLMKVGKVPTDELSYKNLAVINEREPGLLASCRHVEVIASPAHRYVFSIARHPQVMMGIVGFSMPQRKWAMLSLNQEIEVRPFEVNKATMCIASITVQATFFSPKKTTTEAMNTDQMVQSFLELFMDQMFTSGQQLVFQFENKPLLTLVVTSIEVLNFQKSGTIVPGRMGLIYKETNVIFDKVENSPLNLVGKAKSKAAVQSIINPDWDFNKMGIGGLDKEFSAIFRRAFASRVFPPEIVQQLGMKHCRGILLFGPPGTGKTLMARQIGQMLNAREPKIVNGPEILDKYVGESEAKIRKLFEQAEEEEKRLGPNSGLHIIIFDEIDAICKSRGSMAGSTAVHDTVVNQLLSKIDGVDQLNNILVIGMTNRKDMIDDALLRPGRLEVQMEIGLPSEHGRVQILNIHTAKMKENKKLAPDFDVNFLAKGTKNFSGAEIEGLVRAATSTAMNKLIKASSKVEIDTDATEQLQVSMADFRSALKNDCKPAFGVSEEELSQYCANGIIPWGEPVRNVLNDAELLVNQTRLSDRTPLITVLLSGAPNSGKTALAAEIAKNSEFPFLKICSPENMIGFTEPAKCHAIKKVFDDAYKSPFSCIILDDIERLLDYVSIGPRFSNLVLQAILVLLKKAPPPGKRLLVLGTTSRREVLEQMEMTPSFTSHIHVSNLSEASHVIATIDELGAFTEQEMASISRRIADKTCWIGIKKLIALTEMAIQTESDNRVNKFLILLEEQGGLQ